MINRFKNSSDRRKARVAAKVSHSSLDYRLVIRRSNKYIYAQMLQLSTGKTLFGLKGTKPGDLGKKIAEKALESKINKVVFDRGSYKYHGNIRLIAEACREAGLVF